MSMRTIYNKLSRIHHATTQGLVNNKISKFIEKNKLILHGSRAMNAQAHFPYQRAARDFDILTRKNAKPYATKLDKELDQLRNGNYHYVKPARHRGTYMVMDIGNDLIPRTRDDFELASLTKLPRKRFKTIKTNNLTYAHLDELEKSKRRALRFKKYQYRHKKDRQDLKIIQMLKGGFI